jgi:four helix bundle protein
MRKDPILIAAVRQAATSVMAAVAEAFRETDLRHAIKRLRQAEDSVRDVRGLFYVAIESGLFGAEQYEDLATVAARAGRAISALTQAARSRAHGEIDLC